MNHWIALPIVLPALTAALLLVVARNDLRRQRVVSAASAVGSAVVAIALFAAAQSGPHAYLVGDWPAPFGIVLVLDRLSALMLLLTAGIARAALLYAVTGWDARGRHFHVLFHFQLLGTNGAFLTGDVFNLFVFFEVMLIASYGLVLHGGGVWRLKAGFQYVAINIVASTLFLFAVGLIYGVTGTLNMADLALKVRALAEGDHALLRTGALLLFTVFALKCALVPLHWWLPSAYAAAPAPAVALFAILSKVGAYAVIRMHTLAFAEDAAGVSTSLQTLLFWAATVTVLVGAIGVLASRSILGLAAYSIIGSMGTLLIVAAGLEPRQLSRPPHQAALREPLAEDIRVIAWACAFALTAVMLAMLFSLYRLLAGPATTDRILALDTLVINAIAAVVLMGVVWGTTMYFEVAVLFAMVAFLSTIALCKYLMHGDIIECAHSWLSLSKQ